MKGERVRDAIAGCVLGLLLLAAATGLASVFDGIATLDSNTSVQVVGPCLAHVHRERRLGMTRSEVVALARSSTGESGASTWNGVQKDLGAALDRGFDVPEWAGEIACPPEGPMGRVTIRALGFPVPFLTTAENRAHIRWFGFLATALFWCMLGTGVIMLAHATRRAFRTGRSVGTGCRYPRTDSNVCPECGQPY